MQGETYDKESYERPAKLVSIHVIDNHLRVTNRMVKQDQIWAFVQVFDQVHIFIFEGLEGDNIADIYERASKCEAKLDQQLVFNHHYRKGKDQTSHNEPKGIKEHYVFPCLVGPVEIEPDVKLSKSWIKIFIAHLTYLAPKKGPYECWQSNYYHRKEERKNIWKYGWKVMCGEFQGCKVHEAAEWQFKVHEKD